MKTSLTRSLAIFGLCAAFLGAAGTASAQSWRDVRHDRVDMRRDHRQLDDMIAKRHRDAERGRFREVRRDDAAIAAIRRDLREDRHDLRHDRW